MRIATIAGLAAVGIFSLAGASRAEESNVVSIELPEDHDTYRPGPHVQDALDYCAACHAADYVYMQPPLTRAQWEGEVAKMRTVFHCPVPDDKAPSIVDYLMSQDGKTD
jgi:hypothetical protein